MSVRVEKEEEEVLEWRVSGDDATVDRVREVGPFLKLGACH